MPLKLKTRLLCGVFFFSLCLFVLNSSSCAQDDLLADSGGFPKTYMVEMSGKVLNEEFWSARASVEISISDPGSLNPYLVVIRGFPKVNSKNTFFWDSDATELMVLPGEITSDIKRTFMRPLTYVRQPKTYIQCHFAYLSPILIKPIKGRYIDPPREQVNKELAMKRAMPTLVFAQAGRLRIRVAGDMISGNVWMKGYDLIERSYVEYNASFAGETATRLKPKLQGRDPLRTTGGERPRP
ncbi:MAG: hypothetical protein ABSG35_20625 [Syntrophobacteraceae bacterium]|jgi:hypothetical protein